MILLAMDLKDFDMENHLKMWRHFLSKNHFQNIFAQEVLFDDSTSKGGKMLS